MHIQLLISLIIIVHTYQAQQRRQVVLVSSGAVGLNVTK